jgi:Flp pilus assembly protein TadG
MLRRPWRDERGTAATLLLFPVFAVVAFMFVQALLWQHERQMAGSVADRAANAVALYGSSPDSTRVDAVADLRAVGLRDVSVSITRGVDETVVVVSGTAPGILIGTSSTVSVRSITPTERFQP